MKINFSKNHFLALGGTVVLIALLYLVPRLPGNQPVYPDLSSASKNATETVSGASERALLEIADSLREGFESENDSITKRSLGDRAISTYKKVLEMNPANLNAKAGLGLTYAEATSDPMQGIMLLREVVKTDPDNEQGQYYLGMLSVQSGQLDKAIERFEKVYKINSENISVLLFLGNIYLKKGDKVKALENFKAFKSRNTDTALQAQVTKTIEKIEAE